MRLSILFLFLTLVVSGLAANAAPVVDHQPNPIEFSPKDNSEPIFSSDKTEHNISLRFGFLGGAFKETNLAGQMYFYGLRYDLVKEPLSAWQIEVDLAKDNFVHIVFGKKSYFPLETVTMPYYKWSVGDLVDSTEGIGSVFNLKKIQAIAAIGLDDLFKWNQRLQGELSVSYALIGPQFEFSLGYAF